MSSEHRGGAGPGAVALVARLHATLDALLALDPAEVVEADLPGLVTGLVCAGHRLAAAQLDAVGALDASGLAAASRHRTTSRWVEARTRLGTGAAVSLVRQARVVRDHLPATRDALAAGEVSAQHAGAVCQVVSLVGVEHAIAAEPILLGLARRADPGVVRRAAAHLHAALDPDAAQAALDRVYDRRGVTLSVANGRAYLDGVLDLEAAETLQAALMPLMTPGPGETRSAPQRRADALVDLARRTLDAGELPTLGGARPHLSVVVDAAALGSGRGAVTLPWTGAAVPAATVTRWACDAHLNPVIAVAVRGGGWKPLAVGRSARTVTPAQLAALRVRDGGCVHPGCTRTAAFCDAHHVTHWADGGPTDVSNLVLLCRHHHRTLHAGHWQIRRTDPDQGVPEQRVHDWIAAHPDGHITPLQTATDRSPPLSPVA
jgi:hypothetical protein